MCLIIQANKPSTLDLDLMECAYENNSNGFGIMFYNKGKIHTHKIVPKTFDDIRKMWSKYSHLNISMGLHFRFTTVGDTKRSLSHPFKVLTKGVNGSDRDLFVMHNGARLPTPIIDKDKSDTHQFIKWVIRPQLENNPNLLYNAEWTESLEDLIGSDKLLFLDSKTQEFTTINRDEGKDVVNVGWVSNTYSINRGVGFNYDIDKGTKVVDEKSDWLSDYDNYGNVSNYNTYARKSYLCGDTYYDDDISFNMDIYDKGSEIQDKHLIGLTVDETIELCEANPIGVGVWLHDICNETKTKTKVGQYETK